MTGPSLEDLEFLITKSRRRRHLPPPELRYLIRRRAELTQGDLAEAFQVSRPTISRWETGARTPSGKHLTVYAALLEFLDEDTG